MNPVNFDYRPAKYCFDRGFHFLSPSRDDRNSDTIAPPEVLDIYIDGSKLDNGVGNGVYSGRVDLDISLRLPDYCSIFQGRLIDPVLLSLASRFFLIVRPR